VESGRPVCSVAEELGIDFSILYRWKNRYARDLTLNNSLCADKKLSQSEEIAVLRRDIDRIQESVDILKTVLRKTLTNMCDFK